MDAADRKELLRRYKETALEMGVFRVRRLSDGKSYLGTSRNLAGMLNRQRFQLENGAHPDRELQRDFTASGAEGFAFEIVDTLEADDVEGYDPKDDLAALLDLWFDRLEAAGEQHYGTRRKRRT